MTEIISNHTPGKCCLGLASYMIISRNMEFKFRGNLEVYFRLKYNNLDNMEIFKLLSIMLSEYFFPDVKLKKKIQD